VSFKNRYLLFAGLILSVGQVAVGMDNYSTRIARLVKTRGLPASSALTSPYAKIQYEPPLEEDVVEIACNHAPVQVKEIIETLKSYPEQKPLRSLYLFVGATGAGKTILAKAVAQKAGWPCVFVSVPLLADEYENCIASNLKNIMVPILQQDNKCVILLDEFSAITDGYNLKNGAAAALAMVKHCANQPNIFVIGTTIDATALSYQQRNLFKRDGIIEIPLPCAEARADLICNKFQQQIDDGSLDQTYVDFLTRKTNGKSFRDIIDLFNEVAEKADFEDREIDQSDIDAVIKQGKSWWQNLWGL